MSDSSARRLPRPFVVAAVVIGVVAVAYLAAGLVVLAVGRTVRGSQTVAAVERLRIDAGSGDVAVVGEQRDDIRIDTRHRRAFGEPELSQAIDGDRLVLRTRCSFWEQVAPGPGCGGSFEIRVPHGTAVEVEATSGDTSVADVRGPVTVDVSSADIRVVDVAGPLRLTATSGDIDVQGYRGHDAEVRATSGDLEVRTAAVPRRLVVRASSGDVRIVVPDAPYRVETEIGAGDEDVQVRQDPDAPNLISVRTSSGDVEVARLDDAR